MSASQLEGHRLLLQAQRLDGVLRTAGLRLESISFWMLFWVVQLEGRRQMVNCLMCASVLSAHPGSTARLLVRRIGECPSGFRWVQPGCPSSEGALCGCLAAFRPKGAAVAVKWLAPAAERHLTRNVLDDGLPLRSASGRPFGHRNVGPRGWLAANARRDVTLVPLLLASAPGGDHVALSG